MSLSESVVAFLPLAAFSIASLFLLVLAPLRRVPATVLLAIVIGSAVIALAGALWNVDWQGSVYGGTVAFGGTTNVIVAMFAAGEIVIALFAHGYLQREGGPRPEFYTLLQFAVVGMALMAAARDFVVLFVGLELMSLCFYVLAGMFRTRATSNEAALKYFFLGAFATGFFLYGVALIYGTTGTTHYSQISLAVAAAQHQPLYLLGCGMVLVTFLFKIAAVPFHMWAPDVYEGSPTVVSALMSSLGKAAALTALATMSGYVFDGVATQLRPVIGVIAVLTMAVGNIAALRQDSVKRMLAYSSVAHAGYALVGLAALGGGGRGSVYFYAIVYSFMQAGAFGVVGEIERDGARMGLADYRGLSTRRPLLALALSVFLFSLAGFPPFGGFFGKYYLFAAAVSTGQTWLAIAGVLASMVSVYYYIGLVMRMYFQPAESDEVVTVSPLGRVAFALTCGVVMFTGILPGTLIDLVAKYLS